MATAEDYFEVDFSNVMKLERGYDVGRRMAGGELAAEAETVRVKLLLDFEAGAQYAAILMPASLEPGSVELAMSLAQRGELSNVTDISNVTLPSMQRFQAGEGFEVRRNDSQVEIEKRPLAGPPIRAEDLTFTGVVYLYTDRQIQRSDEQVTVANEAGISLQLRDASYIEQRVKWDRPDAFVSHDSRDRDAIAREIAVGLKDFRSTVWFDEYSLKLGDSLRESIEKGLKECRKCILILTPNYLSNSGWTKTEFSTVFTRELVDDEKVIIPVWDGVTKEEVYDYSPTLADRVALIWDRSWDKPQIEVAIRKLQRSLDD